MYISQPGSTYLAAARCNTAEDQPAQELHDLEGILAVLRPGDKGSSAELVVCRTEVVLGETLRPPEETRSLSVP